MIQKKEALATFACDMHGEALTIGWVELFTSIDFDLPIWNPKLDDDEKEGFFVTVASTKIDDLDESMGSL